MEEKTTKEKSGPLVRAKVSFILLLIGIGIVCLGFVAGFIEGILGVGNVVSNFIRPLIEMAGCFFPVILVLFSVFGLSSFIGLLKNEEKTKKPYIYALTSFIIGLAVIWTIAIISILGLIRLRP